MVSKMSNRMKDCESKKFIEIPNIVEESKAIISVYAFEKVIDSKLIFKDSKGEFKEEIQKRRSQLRDSSMCYFQSLRDSNI